MRAVVDGVEVVWPEPSLAADVDEVEFGYPTTEGLGLLVRHSFTADWRVRVALVNHTLDPLTVVAALTWRPITEDSAWALGAVATGAYAILGPEGRGPLLGGELVLGICDTVSEAAIGLGRLELGPLERRVVQWRWGWYANARVFNRSRFPAVPRDLVLPENEVARIVADEDTAVVAPGVEAVRRGPYLELSSSGEHRVRVEVRSRRGVTAYDMAWVPPLDDALTALGEVLLDGPRTRAGVVVLPSLDAGLVLQHLLVRRRMASRDQAEDALGLFLTRAVASLSDDGRGVSLLCGEFERTGDPDLLEQATAHLLALPAGSWVRPGRSPGVRGPAEPGLAARSGAEPPGTGGRDGRGRLGRPRCRRPRARTDGGPAEGRRRSSITWFGRPTGPSDRRGPRCRSPRPAGAATAGGPAGVPGRGPRAAARGTWRAVPS